MAQSAPARRAPTLRKKTRYAGVKEVTGMTAGREDWNDNALLGLKSIQLSVLTNDQMKHEIQVLIHGMTVNMSPRAVGAALLLTWNLRSTDRVESRVFPTTDDGEDPEDEELSVFQEEGETYVTGETLALANFISEFSFRRSGAFLAASTLKMFSKDSSSWILAWDNSHFSKRYESFTKKQFALRDLAVKKEEIEKMYECYQGHKIFQGTLGRILYAVADVSDKRQTEMLFEQHLSCTGMHIVPQFVNAKVAIGASTEDLLCALEIKQNEGTLKQLRYLINNSLSKPLRAENRGTWRFARLFDPTAYSLLQTKYCQDTVAILAYINDISKAPNQLSSPLNIAVLRQMGPLRMKQSKAVARNIHHYFTVTARALEK